MNNTITSESALKSSGVFFMFVAMFLFAAADAHAKYLTAHFHPVQIIWFRQFGLFLGVVVLLLRTGPQVLNTGQRSLQILRGILAIGSSLLFVFALRHVALADAVAASFVAPFFVTILGVLILGEKVGLRRWSAVIVGFAGALIIVRPGLGVIHPAAMLVVFAAALYATRQVLGRVLARTDSTRTTVVYTALVSTALITLPLPLLWKTPVTLQLWLVLASMSVFASIGEIFLIRSLESSEAAAVAPIHYTLIVWGTLYGYIIFNQFPDRWTWLGTAFIICAGLYTFSRERALQLKS